MKRWTEAVKPAPPVTRTPLQDAGVMADQILQGNVVEANLNDGTFTRLMDEFRRRGYELAKRSEAERYMQPFLFKVKKRHDDNQ